MPKRNSSEVASNITLVFVTMFMYVLQFPPIVAFATADQPIISKSGCSDTCGGVSIPYPFGIGSNCFLENFGLSCDMINGTYMPFFGDLRVLNISLPSGQLRANNPVSSICPNDNNSASWYVDLSGTSFRFNNEKNQFIVIGCNITGYINLYTEDNGYNLVGCSPGCPSLDNLANGSCSGVGCCQTPIPDATNYYEVQLQKSNNTTTSRCGYAALMEYAEFEFNTRYITTDELLGVNMSVVLDWTIGNQTCKEARLNPSSFACISGNSYCVDSSNVTGPKGPGYLCNCSSGYQGNPYLQDGCQDIDECLDKSKCSGTCKNMLGGYECHCPSGKHIINGTTCEANQMPESMKLLTGISVGVVVLLLCFFFLNMANQRRKFAILKEKYFQQYGGMMLLDEMKSAQGQIHTFKLFSEKELKEGTNNFDENTVLGRGGNGTVYKGTLTSNDVVAIKRCKTIDERQKKEFGKEILILSQINHKNIVKILGCCIEVEIPILIYEFIPKGTLFELIHEKRIMNFSFSIRLRIASEVAEALAYLHSWANPPIVHRDVKSSNILLDENFMAKVSDFGASVLAPTDEDQFATMVQGTRGYLDPEYLRSGQLTVKSDVYSFGVVLLELLTGKKALCFDEPEEDKTLSSRFLSAMKENRLEEILDGGIMNEEDMDLIKEVAELAKTCLQMEGEKRPEMKEIAEELDRARKSMKHHPWRAENLEEKKSLLARGESSKSHEMEMTGPYSLETRAMLGSGR